MFFNLNNPGRAIFGWCLLALALLTQQVGAKGPGAEAYAEFPMGFEGRMALAESSLRETAAVEISRFYKHGHRRADADDAAFKMEQLYHRSGFAFATVQYRYADVSGKPGVLFTIAEGAQVELETIALAGNSSYPPAVLLPLYESKRLGFLGLGPAVFDKSRIISGANAIRDFYLGEGFLEVQLEPPEYEFSLDHSRVLVKQSIHEGVRYLIHKVEYSGEILEKFLPKLEAIRRELTGKPYYRRQELALENQVLQLYGDEGYADAAVTVDAKLNSAAGQAVMQARILSGLPITISQVEVFGNTVTQASFIVSRLPLKAGQPLRRSQKNQSFSNLYATGLFSEVNLSLKKSDHPQEKILQVSVAELPFKELYAEAGYGSYEWLRFLAGFKEKNIFGSGRIFRTEAGASFKGETALTGIIDPWFLNTEVTGDLSVFYRRRQEPEYLSQEFGSTTQFSQKLFEHGFLSLGYTLLSTRLFNVLTDADLKGVVTHYQTGAVTLLAYFDTRDNPLYPAAGQKTIFSAEFSNPNFGSQIRYSRFSFGTQAYRRITSSSVLALRYNTGLIVPGEGLDVIPLDQRFYNGGANSVRSFQEHALGPIDPLGGHSGGLAYNAINLEWRQHLISDIGVNFFFDTGNISPNRSREQAGVPLYPTRTELIQAAFSDYFREFRSALGAGLEYDLPIGPARLDFGLNPSPAGDRKEAAYAIHFSIGMMF